MAKGEFDKIGIWSETKLDIIRDYATEYSRILGKQRSISKHLYIDAFAGAGTHVSRATGEFVPGSPLNALNVEPPFTEFHFIDLDESRAIGLQAIADTRGDVIVHHGDCNDVLLREVFPRCRYKDYSRALCLLDPYALSVNWNVLATAGEMRSIEIFYNFMIMDANMNVFRRDPGNVDPDQRARMDAVWGDSSWQEAVYRKEQKGLFDRDFYEEKASNDQVAKVFQTRLREVAGFEYVPDPIPMRNATDATIYYLYFASFNKVGAKIVDHIFRKHAK